MGWIVTLVVSRHRYPMVYPMRYLAALTLAAATACTPSVPPPAVTPRTATPVAASFDRVWSATIDMIAAFSIPVKTIDRASGFVVTETMSIPSRNTAFASADCGTVMGMPIPATNVSYNVRVQGDTARSTIMATARWVNTTSTPTECTTTWAWERAFEDSVRVRAERRP